MFAVFLVPFTKILEATVTDEASIIEYWFQSNVVESSTEKKNNKRSSKIIGLDCKWGLQSSFSKSHKISTIQFCFGTKCLIIQLQRMKCNVVNQSLEGILVDPSNVFVGIEVEEVVWTLERDYKLRCTCVVDVFALAKRRFPISFCGRKIGLKTLACRLLNIHPWKPIKPFETDGSNASKLDKEHVKSVCVDVNVLYLIGIELL